MYNFKIVSIVICIGLLNVSCTPQGGLNKCGQGTAMGIVGGALAGYLYGGKKTAVLGAAAGGAVGALIACYFNKEDEQNVVTALNTNNSQSQTVQGWCLNNRGVKSRGIKVEQTECSTENPPVNMTIEKAAPTQDGKVCKSYTTELIPPNGGEPKTEKAMACRGADGVFRPVG